MTSWSPSVNGAVHALQVVDGTVYVGGTFDNVGGVTRYRLAAIDAATGLTDTWDPAIIGDSVKPSMRAPGRSWR